MEDMKKNVFLLLLCLLIISSCSNKEISLSKTDVLDIFKNSYINLPEKKENLDKQSLNEYFLTLSDEEKVAQIFLISMDGNSQEQIKYIITDTKTAPGGFLLFAFNIPESADKMIDFMTQLENAYIENGKIPPFISIDHEGGVVNRLRNICSKLPSQLSVAQKFSPEEALRLYELQGIQLRNLGIQVNLAPVVEVLTDENILFLDDRSYGNLENVITYSKAQISGMRKAGVLPVLKHFPGNTNNDPHTGLPILNCDLLTLEEDFLKPFYSLLDSKMCGALVAHTVTPAVDDNPACLSGKVINLLTDNASFNGLTFSDDLLMKALIKNGYPVEKSLIEAVNSGINILMISTSSYDEYTDIILAEYKSDKAFREKVDESVKKILEWKISCNLLEREYFEKGFFEYSAEVHLPSEISDSQIVSRKNEFEKAYSEASELYNEIWWAR